MRSILYFCTGQCLLWALSSPLAADELNGVVVNPQLEPIRNVTILSDLAGHGTTTDPSGFFTLSSVGPNGSQVKHLSVSSVGFLTRIFDAAEVPDTIMLQPVYHEVGDILITSERARTGVTPIAHENISRERIEREYVLGDVPLLLNSAANVHSYSDGGGNLGYTYMQIRGFDDKRVATYLNGVPLNDPEDQYSYWADHADFLSSVSDIQIQRGVGNSLYGDASFGGSVNVVSTILNRERELTLGAGYGNYLLDSINEDESYKSSVSYHSGLIDKQWAFGGRFSKTRSDGYRELSQVDSWSYYLAGARLGNRSVTEFQTFGGPMSLHLAFFGAPRDVLEINRRANPLSYRYETDNFNQPHYHLHHRFLLNERASLFNTFYYVRGKGYFEQFVAGANYSDYNIDSSQADSSVGNLVRQQHVAKYQLGWNPRLDIEYDRGRHSLGGSLYYFSSTHWGEVTWAQQITGQLSPRHRYYEYTGEKWVGSVFAEEQYRLTGKLTTHLTAQVRYQKYDFAQTKLGAFAGYMYDTDWLFFSPRAGLNYLLVEKPENKINAYVIFAVASRTPTDAAIYDASNPHAVPSLKVLNRNIIGRDTMYTFGEPTAEAERVYDLEFGARYRGKQISGGINLYWMDLQNEIIPYGELNPSTGQLATVNSNGSVRMGAEFDGTLDLFSWLNVAGNISFNRSRVDSVRREIPIYDTLFNEIGSVGLISRNKKAPLFPEILGNATLNFTTDRLRVSWQTRYVGKQFADLSNTDSLSIPGGFVSALGVSVNSGRIFDFGDLTLNASVSNLFNRKYETSGYGYSYAVSSGTSLTEYHAGEYYVAAETNIFVQASLRMF